MPRVIRRILYMPIEERCSKYPSILKAHCSHCQGTQLGTGDNPRFTLEEYESNGYPVVEVLKNGGPVHFHDANFRFGIRKAKMLLACITCLREFWMSTEDERLCFKLRLVVNKKQELRVEILVKMHPDLEISTGRIVDRPWLHLQALPPDDEAIGLGMMKCRAICAVAEDLKQWLYRQGTGF